MNQYITNNICEKIIGHIKDQNQYIAKYINYVESLKPISAFFIGLGSGTTVTYFLDWNIFFLLLILVYITNTYYQNINVS